MSAQQILSDKTIEELKTGIDKALKCIGDRFLLSNKFGVKNVYNKRDLFLLDFYKNYLSDRFCNQDFNSGFLERIQTLTLKYT